VADTERIEVGEACAILRGESVVGVVRCRPEEHDVLRRSLEGAGYRVEQARQDGEQTYELGGECDEERPRTCELEITLGRIQELAEEAGVPSTEVDALERRPFTEREARAAAEAVVRRMPEGERREEAEGWVSACFDEEPPADG
jgi:hypothetical protein